jgi:hypothetical protein
MSQAAAHRIVRLRIKATRRTSLAADFWNRPAVVENSIASKFGRKMHLRISLKSYVRWISGMSGIIGIFGLQNR